ncbi:diphthamide biosynthesis protein 1 [Trichuris trichiura]|uniref:Diphthamide biosynthesis protein 1 n=1 Tax=Trichuris trichiura TaxID=36087 RepID=A0A077YV64_TRITR|nr:diphthamide biosynthesis protein 1 [Trichuris trichiura]
MICMLGFCVVNVIHSLQLFIHRHHFDIHSPLVMLITGTVDVGVKMFAAAFLDFSSATSKRMLVCRFSFYLSPSATVLTIATLRLMDHKQLVAWLDPFAAICTCATVAITSTLATTNYLTVLLMAVPKQFALAEICSQFEANENLHHVRVWADGNHILNLSAHVRFRCFKSYAERFESIKAFLTAHGATRVFLQPEFEKDEGAPNGDCLFRADKFLQLHDGRPVEA